MLVHGVLAVVFAGPRPSFASAGAKRRKVVGSMMLSRVASGRHDHLRAPGLGREAWRSAWRPTRLVFAPSGSRRRLLPGVQSRASSFVPHVSVLDRVGRSRTPTRRRIHVGDHDHAGERGSGAVRGNGRRPGRGDRAHHGRRRVARPGELPGLHGAGAAGHRAGDGGGRRDLATERDVLAHARHGGRRRLGSLSAPFFDEAARLVDRPDPRRFGRALSQADGACEAVDFLGNAEVRDAARRAKEHSSCGALLAWNARVWKTRLRGARTTVAAAAFASLAVVVVWCAPAGASGPKLTVAKADLAAAFKCPIDPADAPTTPLMFVTGTGATGDQGYLIGQGAFEAYGHPVCYVNFPDFTTADVQVSVQYLVYALRREYARAGRKVAV